MKLIISRRLSKWKVRFSAKISHTFYQSKIVVKLQLFRDCPLSYLNFGKTPFCFIVGELFEQRKCVNCISFRNERSQMQASHTWNKKVISFWDWKIICCFILVRPFEFNIRSTENIFYLADVVRDLRDSVFCHCDQTYFWLRFLLMDILKGAQINYLFTSGAK